VARFEPAERTLSWLKLQCARLARDDTRVTRALTAFRLGLKFPQISYKIHKLPPMCAAQLRQLHLNISKG
jgi:hypothetical protein